MRTSLRRPAAITGKLRPRVALAALALLAGCTPLQAPGPVAGLDPAAQRAATLAGEGRHDDAAQAYLDLAATATAETRERYLILAARERRAAGRLGAAQAILDSLPDPVAPANRAGWAAVAGDLALARGQPEEALTLLARAPARASPGASAELLRVRGLALFRTGDPVAATGALIEREVWLDQPAEIAANQRLLWEELRRWGGSITGEDVRGAGDPVLGGWLDLGLIAGRPAGGASLAAALRSWQLTHPSHPANGVLLPELLADLGPPAGLPDRLALLLPLSGRQQLAGMAVRDGFLAAHYALDAGDSGPTIRIYDVDRLGAAGAYRQAVTEGAQFVVGPLLKESVQELAATGLTVPALALNYLPDQQPGPAGLYQFALAPEDEASAAADRAIGAGQQRAIALVPNNAWGRRLLNSFASNYQALGGTLLDYRFYDPAAPDFSAGIQNLLLVDESRSRHDRLAANLGMPLGFEPRRRADMDLIFLAATDGVAKLIRPQLKFYYAGDVPTYATSAIYQEGSGSNADLNGIIFADMPWMIEPDAEVAMVRRTLARYWPDAASRQARLYAMGFDAYRLVPQLAAGRWQPGTELPGVTGGLYLGGGLQIHRRLDWARIVGGRPVPLAETVPVAVGEQADDSPPVE